MPLLPILSYCTSSISFAYLAIDDRSLGRKHHWLWTVLAVQYLAAIALLGVDGPWTLTLIGLLTALPVTSAALHRRSLRRSLERSPPMAATLTTLRDRTEQYLLDTSNDVWATDAIDEGIRLALHEYSYGHPLQAESTITLGSDGREIDISSLTGRLTVLRVWCDYDSSNPAWPPTWADFEIWPGDVLFIDSANEPGSGEKVRIFYTKLHTLNGLDAEGTTTIPLLHESMLVIGSAGHAATARSRELMEQVSVDEQAVNRLRSWGEQRLADFRKQLHSSPPYEQTRQPAWTQYGLETYRWPYINSDRSRHS